MDGEVITGISYGATSIAHCYNTGDITVDGLCENFMSVGGIAYSATTVVYCYNTGNINISGSIQRTYSGTYRIAGIVASATSVSYCYNTGNINTLINDASCNSGYTMYFYTAGISTNATSNGPQYNTGNITNYIYKSGGTVYSYVGGINTSSSGSLQYAYNTGSLYNNVEASDSSDVIYTYAVTPLSLVENESRWI